MTMQSETSAKKPNGERTTVRCILMQKDESDLLPLWIHYHGELFGYQNLFIFDNGSGPETRRILYDSEQKLGVHVDYTKAEPEDFESKGTIVGSHITRWSLNKLADFYFPLDCDEFVGISLEAGYSCSPEYINHGLQQIKQSQDSMFQVCERLDNSWHDETVFYKIPRARKLFFGNSNVIGLDVGFHQCQHPSHAMISNIVYFHFHNRPFDQLRKFSMRKLQLRLSDSKSTNATILKNYQGPGAHLIRGLTCTPEEYSEWLHSHPRIQTSAPRDRFNNLGFSSPWASELQKQ